MAKNTLDELLAVSRCIGQIVGSNGHYTDGLARHIDATGKRVNELTVIELMRLHIEYKKIYHKIHGY